MTGWIAVVLVLIDLSSGRMQIRSAPNSFPSLETCRTFQVGAMGKLSLANRSRVLRVGCWGPDRFVLIDTADPA